MNERRAQIRNDHPLPKTRRCNPLAEEDLALMRLLDEIHLPYPFFDSPRIRDEIENRNHHLNRKRVQRLMRHLCTRCIRGVEQANRARGT